MINRTLVRTKVVQTLYAFFQSEGKTISQAEKELLRSFSDTYNLYFLLLDLVDEVTRFVDERQQENAERAQAMHTSYSANPRFVKNKFAQQLFENRTLRKYLDEQKLSWESVRDHFPTIVKKITDSSYYTDYLALADATYEDDKVVWRKIMANILAGDEDLAAALEDLEVTLDGNNWSTDMDIVISYIIKTIKRFREDNKENQPLLEMFDSEDELNFATTLLRESIRNSDDYEKQIADHLKNWDPERVAYMDMVILKVALAEAYSFPEIALQVTFDEYLNIAHEYSTDNSPQFINGVLNEILHTQRRENNFIKAMTLK